MEKKSSALNWLLFFASVGAFFLLFWLKPEFITVTLPFVCYYLAKSLDLI